MLLKNLKAFRQLPRNAQRTPHIPRVFPVDMISSARCDPYPYAQRLFPRSKMRDFRKKFRLRREVFYMRLLSMKRRELPRKDWKGKKQRNKYCMKTRFDFIQNNSMHFYIKAIIIHYLSI